MVSKRNGNRISALLAAGVILLLAFYASQPVAVQASPPPQGDNGPEPGQAMDPARCAECHAEEYQLWQQGAHAHASAKASFQQAWERLGELPECLDCHTTGYDAASNEWVTDNVTCVACHTAAEDGNHPPALMTVDVASERCGECHENTYQEWLVSGHGQRGIECASCHMSHSQAPRIEPTDQLCHQCHGGRFEDFAHSSHAAQDLTCTECHMPANPAAMITQGVGGINTLGHTFNVGAQTCAECHQDEIHGLASAMVSEAGFEIDQVDPESQAVESAQERVRLVSSENETLQRELQQQQVLTYVGGAFALGIGIFVGLVAALVLIFVLQRRETA